MKSRKLSLLAGLLMIGILATTPNLIKSITIEDTEILDNSLIAIANINGANIQNGQFEADLTNIAA